MTDMDTPDFTNRRWADVYKLLNRSGPFADPSFEPSEETKEFLHSICKVLVIGAGGLGCELLKNLALSGFKDIHVIDLDTIDVTNLNRQFLFRKKDVSKSKCEVAAQFVMDRVPGVTVTPYFGKIQDLDADYYSQFHIIISGLDSIEARRWINGLLVDMVQYEEDGSIDMSTVKPLIDGGTEGFKGQARVILPRITACFECTLDLFPPQVKFPLCTIASTPRQPAHCIEYASMIEWPAQWPFGQDVKVDKDNPDHIQWLYEKALARASQFGIRDVTYRLTQGVIKNIIPAIASTNAVIAAACTNEALKLATLMSAKIEDYMMYNGSEGIYTYTFKNEQKAECPVCGVPKPKIYNMKSTDILSSLIELLKEDIDFRVRNPSITIPGKSLYMTNAALEPITRPNLEKPLSELMENNTVCSVTDSTLTNAFFVQVVFTDQQP